MSLKTLRKKIDAIDTKVVSLLNERAKISLRIRREKILNKQGIYSPDREKAVLDRVKKLSTGPLSPEAFAAIYREIMSSSLSLARSLKIAYLGPEATFTHLAALKKFGSQVDYISCGNISEVFQRVEKGECDHGVVPIENSIEGAVTHTFDLLVDSDLKICSQILLEISHNLLAKANVRPEAIKTVYSHPQVFGQCRNWLATHIPRAEQVEVSSTTRAAQIALSKKNAACIASPLAARVYNLQVIKKSIEDTPHNITRFLVISTTDVPPTGSDRTAILFFHQRPRWRIARHAGSV